MTLKHLDDTLDHLDETPEHYLTLKQIHKHLKTVYPSLTIRHALLILDKLVKDGYVTVEPLQVLDQDEFEIEKVDGYYISFDGIIFKQSGGYIEAIVQAQMQKIYEKEKKDLEISQIKSPLSTDSSVQSTNAATEKNIPVQKRQTNISIALGFLSLAFIIATVVNDYNDTTSKELNVSGITAHCNLFCFVLCVASINNLAWSPTVI